MSGPRPLLRPPTSPAPGARVLVLLCHPALHRSRVNRRLAQALVGLPGVTVHDLYDAWPDFDVGVAHEQALLDAHAHVVFQHPFYWYSAPALLKQWLDLVLEAGWAYGAGGTALRGKTLTSAISTGGAQAAYQPEGHHHHTLEELLTPFSTTARLCGMRWRTPFVVHGTHKLDEAGLQEAAGRYRAMIAALVGEP
ncbi:NAD(P)H-dependent oxidoreductase [Myxococcota bacterium]|nr:NAD(P)H-dependent oxidoreductase [Myxococcota bacterium]